MSKLLIRLKNSSGITIIEIIMVTALILTLGLMSISYYSRFLVQNALGNTVDQLTGSLRKAQIYSMSGRQNGVWGVKYLDNKITLYLTGNSSFDENFSVNNNVIISGFTDIAFAKATGIPNTTATITISGNDGSKTVTVNGQGGVSRVN